MDLSLVKKLLRLIEESDVNEIELEEKGTKIRITKSLPQNSQSIPYAMPMQSSQISLPQIQASAPQPQIATPKEEKKTFHEVRSPIVGTFYLSPSPEAAAYVEVGSKVSPGSVLCIVEAMKLMNEIESDVSGKIVQVMVANGKPVEYNQVLFLIDKS
ncbi:MAG: acetyl-CoA carboxylase biotin carboxyl carrier protein [Bacteroidota bacterium]